MTQRTKKTRYGKLVPIDEAQISTSAWAVWAALSTLCKWETENGQPIRSAGESCVPRVEIIAARAHCSEKTAQRALKELEDAGYIRIAARFGRKSKGAKGEQRSNGYTLYPLGNAPIRDSDRLTAEEIREKLKAVLPNYGE